MAYAGQEMNHAKEAGSPQAHTIEEVGCPVHACHHIATPRRR
jgi:hypothetical protein